MAHNMRRAQRKETALRRRHVRYASAPNAIAQAPAQNSTANTPRNQFRLITPMWTPSTLDFQAMRALGLLTMAGLLSFGIFPALRPYARRALFVLGGLYILGAMLFIAWRMMGY